ncbi:MAG: helicase [Actinophytocola sp.]|uniref:DEAD/DEAH box helicase n=1 Tax=Actinophytocola sp. TaxID=1872138 RepID=UPI001320E535|nr:DEAD/DEAH box helicase [Actinophytocola sp.]MPZ79999.1 helicase [Actinophytocola sp.]
MFPDGLHDIDLAELEDAAGAASYDRGARYARQRAVVAVRWDASQHMLHGTVQGRADVYETSASFFADGGAAPEFELGECSCPVGYNCKHVVALVLTALGAGRPSPAPSRRPRVPTWEESLGSLLDSRSDGPASRSGDTPLAIELTLAPGAPRLHGPATAGPTLRVLARLVRPGKNTWVNSGLSWSRLSTPHYYFDDYLASHVRLLQELYALYRSRGNQSGYYSSEVKSIDLSSFDSPMLWSVLDDAAAIGLRLVHGRKRLGAVDRYGSAQLFLDVTRDRPAGPLVVSPVVRVDGAPVDAAPVEFIGADGHGVIYIDRAEIRRTTEHNDWRLNLAKLAEPVSPRLRQMAIENRRLEVPAAEQARFRDEYYPRLRHLATVTSSDESFTPPAISEPTLVLRASYGGDHHLDVDWEWSYQVGDALLREPLHQVASDTGYRDVQAERTMLANLDVSLERFGLLDTDPVPVLAPHAELRGIDTMRFTTEVLPLLEDQPGVAVEIGGARADYREAGDSLTIGVSTDEVAGETDWFDLGVTITVEGREVPFIEVFLALSRDQSHMLLADGAYFSLEKPELRTLRGLIEEARALRESSDGTLKISRFQAGLWDELTELGVVNRQAEAWQRQVQGLLSTEAIAPTPVPSALTARLRPYQVDGYRWLTFLWESQLGGILADDMGLGKTLQSLALICHARQADPDGAPFLIVAPTSVVSNWVAESTRFAPDLNIVSISDTLRRRGQTMDEAVAGADVVVTSYTLFRLDFDDYSAASWSGLILDEAQFTKNHQSKIHQCARRLPAPFKVGITGTPMENNLMELWSLLSITAPGLFPSPTRFRDYYARPIEKGSDTELLAQLRRRVKPLIKRRTKEQVAADLPAKQEQVLEVELTPRHRKIYQTHLQRERQKVLGLVDDMNKNRFTILRSLTLLRQLSLHAGLVDEAHDGLACAKIDALLEQLADVVDGGHRALVFSQFTGFLDKVRTRLDEAGVEYCYLDGKTRKRAAVLDRFKNGSAPVFLISLKAGGFGLNLTEADYCFLLDPWWNLATEAQAVDRTHRIGQTRNVMVYRLIAKDTIEEKVMALKARKAALFTNVMDDGNVFGSTLEADDIRGLFD